MKEDFVFQYRIDKKVIREVMLTNPKVSLLLGGLAYAKQKDSIPKRREEYKALMDELNLVVHGKSRWSKKTI